MPVYNAGKYVGKAIESILNQTYSNFELIIVNDGSTDDSKDIVLSFNDSRIKYFENETNQNIVKTRNRCISEASGDYVAVLDSDDIALPKRLEQQLEFLEMSPEYGMCGTFYQVIDSDGKLLNKVVLPLTELDTKTSLYFSNCFCHSTIMIRSELVKKFKYKEGFDIIEDYELSYNISKISKIANLPVYLTHYRIHGNNVTIEKKEEVLGKLQKMNSIILQDLKIGYSEEQLKIHTNFLAYNYSFFQGTAEFNPAESWILKVYDQIKNIPEINNGIIAELLIGRWLAICFNTKRYSSIFSLKLLLKFRGIYLKCLAIKLTGN